MIDRWILIRDGTGLPEPEGYVSEKEAWKAAVHLAREASTKFTLVSPDEWTIYKITFEAR